MNSRLRALGPGLVMSSAAVGGSHLVASTQAGALFGWQLLWLILLVNLLKYPFFRFGVQYTIHHGESLVSGYFRKGRNTLLAFTLLNIIAAVVNTAGVLILSASLLQYFLPWELSLTTLCWTLLLICLSILLAGHYRLLDTLSKVLMLVLTLTTVAAVVIAWTKGAATPTNFTSPSPWELSSLAFLVAMIGWMPVPIEISAISSLWTRSKQHLTQVNLKDALFDFNFGYGVAVFLAVTFLALGALIQHGSDQEIALASAAFAEQLVSMYSTTIGEWARLMVAGIAFMCMFGTTLAVMDGYARTLHESVRLLSNSETPEKPLPLSAWIIIQALCGMAVILFFQSALGPMLSFAMTLAFITTPFFAWLNLDLARDLESKKSIRVLAWVGLVYLSAFSVFYVVWWLFF
ncbi:MAG: divalent metal cation transporter [Pseudohongiellaceae bacterium]|nr:divalent metal cation transporter [Pseudohongiellaceae bacterium]